MAGFVPPPYPYDRLAPLAEAAAEVPGGVIDLSIGAPCDPPPAFVAEAMADPATLGTYPPSVGTLAYRQAAARWLSRKFGVDLDPKAVAACIGTKELVAGLPHWLHLRDPRRDTVLYPAVSYPTYAMGATLAGLRAVAVPVDEKWRLRLEAIDPSDAQRALCLWVNTPGNPAGGLDDLAAVAQWGRHHGVTVLSDECYVEFTWDGPSRSILQHGDSGVLAVHSLSKRSNFAGARVGFYAGDEELVHYLSELRKHAGFMVPGPVQAAATLAWDDDEHVEQQRRRYLSRLDTVAGALELVALKVPRPAGAFYLWVPAPNGDSWALGQWLAENLGLLVSPGEFYGPAGAGHLRVAVVQPEEKLELLVERATSAGAYET